MKLLIFSGDAVVVVVEKATETDKIPIQWIAKQVLITDEAVTELENYTKMIKKSSWNQSNCAAFVNVFLTILLQIEHGQGINFHLSLLYSGLDFHQTLA